MEKQATMLLHGDEEIAAVTGNVSRHDGKAFVEVQKPGGARTVCWWNVDNCEPYPSDGWHWSISGTVKYDPAHARTSRPNPQGKRERQNAVLLTAALRMDKDPTMANLAALKLACRELMELTPGVRTIGHVARSRRASRFLMHAHVERFIEAPSQDRYAAIVVVASQLIDRGHDLPVTKTKDRRHVVFPR